MSQWGVSDFALTYSIHEREDLISSEMVSEIGQLDGIENLRLTYAPYPQVVADVVYDDGRFLLLGRFPFPCSHHWNSNLHLAIYDF